MDGIKGVRNVAQEAAKALGFFAGTAVRGCQPNDGREQESSTQEVVQPVGPRKAKGRSKTGCKYQQTAYQEGVADADGVKASGHEHAHTVREEHSDEPIPPPAVGSRPAQSDVALGKAEIEDAGSAEGGHGRQHADAKTA